MTDCLKLVLNLRPKNPEFIFSRVGARSCALTATLKRAIIARYSSYFSFVIDLAN